MNQPSFTDADVLRARIAARTVLWAAGVAASAEDTVFKFYKQRTLHRAWEKTKKSLENPQNRKLALIAREMNPTLAKYTIAYGALIEGNATAMTALNRIGLDRETLARANDKGEREFLDDKARADEISRAQQQITANCE